MTENVVVHIEPASAELTPGGGPVALTVHIVNATSIVDQFIVDVTGGEGWLSSARADVRLFPGEEAAETIQISIPPDELVTAGPRMLQVRVISAADGRVHQAIQLPVTVREISGGAGLSMRLDPQVVTAGKGASLLVWIRNPGNAPVELNLRGEESKGLSSFAFQPPVLTVPPLHEAASAVAVTTQQPKTGTEETRSFTIRAEGQRESLAATGTLTVPPLHPVSTERKPRSAGRFIKLLLAVLLPLAIAAGAVIMLTGGPKVDVPNVIGMSEADAATALQNAGLRASPGPKRNSTEAPGTVIDQNPKSGGKARRNSAVTLIVSLGEEQASVPDLRGKMRTDAEQALRDAGFEVDVTESFSAEVPAGSVIDQTPAANATVAKGSTVSLVVSKGPEPIEVPNVVGMSESDAKAAIEAKSLVPDTKYETDQSTSVLRQSPEAGQEVGAGDTVTIFVGDGTGTGSGVQSIPPAELPVDQ